MKKGIIALICAALTLASCSATRGLSIGSQRYISVEIFQTFVDGGALAMSTNAFSPHCYDVIKLETKKEFYYDGAKVRGQFVMVGRYSYENKQHIVKTVPVYVRATEYKALMKK